MSAGLAIGIDVGTSGVRAVAMTPALEIVAEAATRLGDYGEDGCDPRHWWAATEAALDGLLGQIDAKSVKAISVDGTSGTVLPVDSDGRPLATPLMYNDAVNDRDIGKAVAEHVPAESAAHGPTSGLAKAIHFGMLAGVSKVVHQADWIAGRLCGRFDQSDENNALKTGYDPIERRWPQWIARTGMRMELLPDVLVPGEAMGAISSAASKRFGLSADCVIVAGTTDGCASFLATGAEAAGDAVTALGSTMTIKLLSDAPIFAPRYGIYSHRLGDTWLAGGASNSGGKVLAHYFAADRIAELSGEIDTATESGLDYYPLVGRGERFPVLDPVMQPRLTPRPANDADFLKGMLEGIAGIEALSYRRLAELSAPKLRSVRSVGGGAGNATWTAIRRRRLGVPFLPALSEEAAAGTARLALKGATKAGLL